MNDIDFRKLFVWLAMLGGSVAVWLAVVGTLLRGVGMGID